MSGIKFVRIFLLVLIVIGLGLIITQNLWVPKTVDLILENEQSNPKTYTDTENGFRFTYPNEEQVIESSTPKGAEDAKGIYLEVIDSKDSLTCLSGEDMRCKNIVTGDHKIVVQYSISGNIYASADISNGKSVLLTLSCDSIGPGMIPQSEYCEIREQRQEMFDSLLSSFEFTN